MIISLEFNKEPLIAVKPFYAIIGKSEERMVKPKRFVQIGNRLFDTAFPVIRRKEEVKRWRKLSVKDLRREIQITARNFHCSEELLFIFILNYFYINLKILIKL
jgi:hypothetical protein